MSSLRKRSLSYCGASTCVRHKPGVGGQGPQGHVDHHGGKAVQIQRQQRLLVAVRMLVRLDADFQVPPPDQRRHAHAVVVDQLQLAVGRDHHVGVLQVAVGDPGFLQFGDQVEPPGGSSAKRRADPRPGSGRRPT